MDEEKDYRRTRKRRRFNGRPLLVIGAALLVLYVGTQVASAFSTGIQTVSAARVTVNDSFTATGWFFRDEV